MDVSIINPFLSAAMNVFASMFSIETTPGAPYLLEETSAHRWEISGLLGVTGEYQGVVCFRLHRVLASKMLERSGVITKTEEERQETIHEMIGELTNIIAGNASSAIRHARIEISPPAVILGENHQIAWPKTYPVIAIPFSTPNGPFEVDVCFKKST